MATADTIRNGIIDKLLTISNKDYLTALYKLVQSSAIDNDRVKLTNEQVVMLNMSENDIKNSLLKPQSLVDKEDLKWLKEL